MKFASLATNLKGKPIEHALWMTPRDSSVVAIDLFTTLWHTISAMLRSILKFRQWHIRKLQHHPHSINFSAVSFSTRPGKCFAIRMWAYWSMTPISHIYFQGTGAR